MELNVDVYVCHYSIYSYIRIQMGDELSKRSKFLFLTYIGQEVGVMQRAKMSTDKSIIKDIINVSLLLI